MSYSVFTRNWWREGRDGKLVPDSCAEKSPITTCATEQEARDFCNDGNASTPESWERLSRKYEYTEN